MNYEVRLFIKNEKTGQSSWFQCPIEFDEIATELSLNDGEEYSIVEYESPFTISTSDSIDEINQLAEYYMEYSSLPVTNVIQQLVNDGYYGSLREAFEQIESITYVEAISQSDLAHHIIDETGLLAGISEEVVRYFDYDAYGRDLVLSGDFSELGSGGFVSVA